MILIKDFVKTFAIGYKDENLFGVTVYEVRTVDGEHKFTQNEIGCDKLGSMYGEWVLVRVAPIYTGFVSKYTNSLRIVVMTKEEYMAEQAA